jgi:hypothetical protein
MLEKPIQDESMRYLPTLDVIARHASRHRQRQIRFPLALPEFVHFYTAFRDTRPFSSS